MRDRPDPNENLVKTFDTIALTASETWDGYRRSSFS